MVSFLQLSVFVLFAAVALYGLKKHCEGGICRSDARLDGKTVVITGGNTGIGKQTAIGLAKRGAKIIIACRNKQRGEKAVEDIKKESSNQNVYAKVLDLASFRSIKAFADKIIKSEPKLDILINNAGVFSCPFTKTEDGHESQFGVNHLGHFLLTNLLLDLIKKSAPSRIINVSSLVAHSVTSKIDFDTINKEEFYSRFSAYGVSKLANVLFTRELHERLSGSNVSVFSLHPGVVDTEVLRHIFSEFIETLIKPIKNIVFKNSKQGAQTSICCAVEEGLEQYSGRYFSDCAVRAPSAAENDMNMARMLWDYSIKATKDFLN